jgi:hypothetical protein
VAGASWPGGSWGDVLGVGSGGISMKFLPAAGLAALNPLLLKIRHKSKLFIN